MSTLSSVGPQPIKKDWHKENFSAGEIKEVSGNKALIHWHCGARMRRVITYQKTEEGIRGGL